MMKMAAVTDLFPLRLSCSLTCNIIQKSYILMQAATSVDVIRPTNVPYLKTVYL